MSTEWVFLDKSGAKASTIWLWRSNTNFAPNRASRAHWFVASLNELEPG